MSAFLFILTLDDVLISINIIGSQHGFSVKDLDSVVADKEWVPLGLKFFPFQHQLLLTSWQTKFWTTGPSFLCICVKQFFYLFFIIQDRILLQPNLSVYVCETPSWRFEPQPLSLTPHKHLYLWSDYRTKNVRWVVLNSFTPVSTLSFQYVKPLIKPSAL